MEQQLSYLSVSSSSSTSTSESNNLRDESNKEFTILSNESIDDESQLPEKKRRKSVFIHPRTIYPQEDIKHKALTEKAKMNFKPHLGDAVRLYLQMIREEKAFKNEPVWDSSQQCILKDLIEAIRENESANEQLKKKRMEHKLARIERDKQIEDIKKEEENFSSSFLYYDKFVKENMEKRERFLEKMHIEIKNQEDLVQQIAQADTSIELLNEIKEDMLKCIESRKAYVDYLESVRAKAPDLFPNGVHDIIDRYEVNT